MLPRFITGLAYATLSTRHTWVLSLSNSHRVRLLDERLRADDLPVRVGVLDQGPAVVLPREVGLGGVTHLAKNENMDAKYRGRLLSPRRNAHTYKQC